MKQPHWVLCSLCNDMVYAGPGINPIPRECECKATRVVPTEQRGFVQWDTARYKAEDAPDPLVEYTDEHLDPNATRVAVPQVTIDQAVAHHMNRVASGGEV